MYYNYHEQITITAIKFVINTNLQQKSLKKKYFLLILPAINYYATSRNK